MSLLLPLRHALGARWRSRFLRHARGGQKGDYLQRFPHHQLHDPRQKDGGGRQAGAGRCSGQVRERRGQDRRRGQGPEGEGQRLEGRREGEGALGPGRAGDQDDEARRRGDEPGGAGGELGEGIKNRKLDPELKALK